VIAFIQGKVDFLLRSWQAPNHSAFCVLPLLKDLPLLIVLSVARGQIHSLTQHLPECFIRPWLLLSLLQSSLHRQSSQQHSRQVLLTPHSQVMLSIYSCLLKSWNFHIFHRLRWSTLPKSSSKDNLFFLELCSYCCRDSVLKLDLLEIAYCGLSHRFALEKYLGRKLLTPWQKVVNCISLFWIGCWCLVLCSLRQSTIMWLLHPACYSNTANLILDEFVGKCIRVSQTDFWLWSIWQFITEFALCLWPSLIRAWYRSQR